MTTRPLVLVADDDPGVRSLLKVGLEAVRELGINLGQGYLFGRPTPVEDPG